MKKTSAKNLFGSLNTSIKKGLNLYFNKSRIGHHNSVQEKNSDSVDASLKNDRRDYGIGVRLWNDKDPRADQSFFSGGVPGFVLSQDQRMIDWNTAFETAFSELTYLKRGMKVSDWYKSLDNFRRIPNREGELYGDAVVPITDRDRVVFVSQKFGRMVFMKIMSPMLDRLSGRIIGWNITLNINSVTERVKFFEELHERIQDQSKHARYVVGAEQILAESEVFNKNIDRLVEQVSGSRKILIMGAVKSERLIERILDSNSRCSVTVVDVDADALRHLRTKYSVQSRRLHLVRKNMLDSFSDNMSRFDIVLLNFPKINHDTTIKLLKSLSRTLSDASKVVLFGYADPSSSKKWWDLTRLELEKKGRLEVLKWHWNTVEAQESKEFEEASSLPSEIGVAREFAHFTGFDLVSAKFGLLSGTCSLMTLKPNHRHIVSKQAV